MPPATEYVDQNIVNKATRDFLEVAENERRSRASVYELGWRYYERNHPKPLKIDPSFPIDNNVIVNLVGEAVDRTVAFLFPDLPTIDIERPGEDKPAPEPATPEVDENGIPQPKPFEAEERDPDETYLDECWEYNDGPVALIDTALVGCIGGHPYLRILPVDAEHEYPRLVPLTGDNIITYWKAGDRTTVLWHELRFKAGRELHRIDFLNNAALEQGGAGWSILEYVKKGTKWELLGLEKWPYPLGPIVDTKHLPNPKSYYGKSETQSVGLNDSVNKVASDIKAILRAHASPKTVLLGGNAEDILETSIEGVWAIDDHDASVENLEMESDLASSMNYMLWLKDQFMDESRVAVVKGGPEAFKNLTNLAIKALFMDTEAKTKILQRHYGRLIREISKRFLMLAGKTFEGIKINLSWPSALPMSDLEVTQVIQAQRDMKLISRKSASGELGLDYNREQEQIQQEGDPQLEVMAKLMQGPNGSDNAGNDKGGPPDNRGGMMK